MKDKTEQDMTDEYQEKLAEKFPEMKPVTSAPGLGSLNGFGARLYGHRDDDEESGTYVATRCFCAVFVPVFAIDAWRVAKAPEGGWYFLGKVPLSLFAQIWRRSLAVAVAASVALGVWNSHTGSASYRNREQLKEAGELLEEGKRMEALPILSAVALSSTDSSSEARQLLQAESAGILEGGDHKEILTLMRIVKLVDTSSGGKVLEDGPGTVKALAEAWLKDTPQDALTLFDLMRDILDNDEATATLEENILKTMNAKQPDNVGVIVRLALKAEEAEDFDRCQELLIPVKDKLATTEGARILGSILLAQGDSSGAHALLLPYVDKRIKALRAAEAAYDKALEAGSERILNKLNSNPNSYDYKRISAMPEHKQGDAVDEYIGKKLDKDAGVKRAVQQYITAARYVPVAMDLGMAQLQRARAMADPEERQQEMKEAEATFQAIRGVAGDDDEYRLSMGEVQYWLGREADGKALLDEVLETNSRSYNALLQVGSVLRTLGDVTAARALVEEGYEKANNTELKDNAITLRASMFKDAQDEITWLEKSTSGIPGIEIRLNSARGKLAVGEGREKDAIRFYKAAISGHRDLHEYQRIPNNEALCHFSLYSLTGDPAHHNSGTSLMNKAVELSPDNAVVLLNAADSQFTSATLELLKSRMDLRASKATGGIELLSYCYDNATDRDRINKEYESSPACKRALELLEKTLLVAPKNSTAYGLATGFHYRFNNVDKLKELLRIIDYVELDTGDYEESIKKAYSGANDERNIRNLKGNMKRFEDLLAGINPDEKPLAYVYASSFVIGFATSLDTYGTNADADRLVSMAEKAVAVAPCSASRSILGAALTFRGMKQIMKDDPAIAKLRESTWRALDYGTLLTFLLGHDAQMAKRLAENPDIARIIEKVLADGNRYPKLRGADDWMMLRFVNPSEAEVAKQAYLANEATQLMADLGTRLSKSGPRISEYMLAMMNGKPDEAAKILDEAEASGVPVPRL